MATPRSQQFDPSKPPWVHCISRCVRRAFLCGMDRDGRDLDHRKHWVEDRLRLIAGAAACEVAGYAVMSSHLHAVVRMRPDVAAGWSARAVVERWLTLWPRQRLADGTPVALPAEEVAILAQIATTAPPAASTPSPIPTPASSRSCARPTSTRPRSPMDQARLGISWPTRKTPP